MRSWRAPSSITGLLTLSFALAGCPKKDDEDGKDDGKADDGKADGKADGKDDGEDDGEPTLQVAGGDETVEGPVPPDTSMVLFSIEGALVPVACFDKDAGAIKAGDDCKKMVKEGDEVRLDAGFSNARNKALGGPTEPQCLAGAGKEVAIAVENLKEANYKYATWPPSGVKAVKLVDAEETTGGSATTLDEDTEGKLLAAIKKDKASVGDELTLHQRAEVELDDNGKKDVFLSVHIKDPKIIEQYAWSGVFLARDGNLDELVLIDKSKSKKDVFELRGTVNLDGAGDQELWFRVVQAEGGGGDRVYQIEGGAAKGVGDWTCGA